MDDKPKGILREKKNADDKSADNDTNSVKWDEDNIKETFHPPGKDYGNMKIDEPPTPYENCTEFDLVTSDDDDITYERRNSSGQGSDCKKAARIKINLGSGEEKEKDPVKEKKFKEKRKNHYDEFSKVKLARKLIEEELKDTKTI